MEQEENISVNEDENVNENEILTEDDRIYSPIRSSRVAPGLRTLWRI